MVGSPVAGVLLPVPVTVTRAFSDLGPLPPALRALTAYWYAVPLVISVSVYLLEAFSWYQVSSTRTSHWASPVFLNTR